MNIFQYNHAQQLENASRDELFPTLHYPVSDERTVKSNNENRQRAESGFALLGHRNRNRAGCARANELPYMDGWYHVLISKDATGDNLCRD